MQTSSPMNNTKIAIVGMNARFGSYSTLDAFERSIYEGCLLKVDTDNVKSLSAKEIDCLAKIALEDAAITPNTNIAMVVANSQQKLSSTVITEVNSVFDALVMAQKLLDDEIEAVLVAGIDNDRSAVGAVVLMDYEVAKRARHKIYAVIDRLSLSSTVEAQDVAYLEVLDDKPLEELKIDQRIHNNYLNNNRPCSCAVSSVINAGYRGIAAEIAGLIKTALCLYYRYIPPVPGWQQTTKNESPFYVSPFAKPWFLEAGVDRRVAAINIVRHNAHIILAEEVAAQPRSHNYLAQTPGYLFPLAANDPQALLNKLDLLKQTIASDNLDRVAKQTFADYQNSEADYALAVVGKNKSEILKECDRATQGIPKAVKTGKDWQTPVGSYFTPKPQGKKGKVAYVYPGAYNAHVGLGKDLFRLFPNLIDDPVIQSTCNRIAGIEKLLYPRSWHKLSAREQEAKERELMNDPLAMLESETGFAGFITTILRDYFQILPDAAFGYSLGETSMMYAQGIWSDIDRSSDVLNKSALFKTRLSGTKEAVREYWQLADTQQGELWRTYVVMANSELVREKIQTESRVYLTQISTPKEVVIAGDPQGCERVIASLGCDAFRAPFNHVIHCEAMKSEYEELIKLNTLPLRENPQITFYSAANYQKINCSSEEIAHSLTQTLCQQLDFPRLVERVYQDDYRVFIEVGVGSNCSRWIKDILKSKEHAVVSLHRRGTNDFTSLVKAIAKLWSHRVQLDMSVLYGGKGQGTAETRRAMSVQGLGVMPIIKDRKAVLKSDRDNLILWQPTYLDSVKDSSLQNNSRLSKTHSLFIQQDWEFSLNNQKAITNHLQALEKIIHKSTG